MATRKNEQSVAPVAALLMVLLSVLFISGANLFIVQPASAHTFGGDESASFLATIEGIKVHLQLAQSNLASNSSLAHEHAGHAVEHLDPHIIDEIKERNERLGRDLPASLAGLRDSLQNSTAQEVEQKIRDIDDLLAETVSVRIERSQLNNSTVQALVLAEIADKILEHYEAAYGVSTDGGEDHGSHEAGATTGSGSSGHSGHGSSSSSTPSRAIVSILDYQSAQAFAAKAQELFTKLKPLAPAGPEESVSALETGISRLVEAIDGKKPLEDVTVIVHGQVHENLRKAFNLPLETGAVPIVLHGTSSTGKFAADIEWIASDELGKANTFTIKLLDAASGEEVEGAVYDIMLYKDGKHLDETHRPAQTSAQQVYAFDEVGEYMLHIDIVETQSGELEEEKIEVPITVVPEFPVPILVLVAAALGGIVAANRSGLLRR